MNTPQNRKKRPGKPAEMKGMSRVALKDGGWFDIDAATKFAEDTRWDGNNNISVNTGDQWTHQGLYRTAKGGWVLNRWSQRQGSTETYEKLADEGAAAWLVANGHGDRLEELGLGEIAASQEV